MKVRSGHAAAYQLLAGPRATRGPARAAGAVTTLALTADDASLAAAAADGAVCIVRVGAASLEPLALLPGLGAPGRTLACWSPDAARLLVAGPGGEAAEVAAPSAGPAGCDTSLVVALETRRMRLCGAPPAPGCMLRGTPRARPCA